MWPEGAKPEQQSLSGDHLVSSRRVQRGSEARGGYFSIPRGGQGVQGVRGGWNKNFLAHNTSIYITKSTEASALANAKQDLAKADLTKAVSYWGLQLGIRAMVDLI